MNRLRRLLRDLLARAIAHLDETIFNDWAETPNGCARLVAFHDAVLDAEDTLESVGRAINDGHLDEAQALIALGRESLTGHITELKELL